MYVSVYAHRTGWSVARGKHACDQCSDQCRRPASQSFTTSLATTFLHSFLPDPSIRLGLPVGQHVTSQAAPVARGACCLSLTRLGTGCSRLKDCATLQANCRPSYRPGALIDKSRVNSSKARRRRRRRRCLLGAEHRQGMHMASSPAGTGHCLPALSLWCTQA